MAGNAKFVPDANKIFMSVLRGNTSLRLRCINEVNDVHFN